MSREELLGRIRDAEAQRRKAGEEARQSKDRILADARKEARRILDEAASEAEAAAARNVSAETKRIQQEKQQVVASGQQHVALQKEKSAARLPAAIDRVCQEFLRQAHD